MIKNHPHSSPNRFWDRFLKLTHVLLMIAVGVVSFAVPVSAQSFEAAKAETGCIWGMVVDTSGDPIPAATIVLQGPPGDRLTAVTKDDGTFAFNEAPARVAYQIAVTAEGQQRIFHFIPNLYVTYEPHPEPLSTKMKFHLAYKDLTQPAFFARVAGWAAVQQAAGSPHWPQDAQGYGKRLGAGLADATTEDLVGNAILPSLLHQDPRYFYQGSGTKKSRAVHAVLAAFICKGDNGAWQPNYSTWGGSLIASSVSMAYYPSSDRDAAHVFKNFGIGMGLHVAGGLAQEFILSKFTSRGKH